ncbi:hypothetical protein [Citreimonas salinaria]|uniref:Uncharacterized protein n=1 Tax=Citreimonas salinaria TaxID=321339 RepID=A0A1H3LZA2_9RHOB|nr:hypothetical protein [Citreimonas salinaria]SDY69656.1 hypothetical protein SAMN05444340_11511 [Citreimonas salinaria]
MTTSLSDRLKDYYRPSTVRRKSETVETFFPNGYNIDDFKAAISEFKCRLTSLAKQAQDDARKTSDPNRKAAFRNVAAAAELEAHKIAMVKDQVNKLRFSPKPLEALCDNEAFVNRLNKTQSPNLLAAVVHRSDAMRPAEALLARDIVMQFNRNLDELRESRQEIEQGFIRKAPKQAVDRKPVAKKTFLGISF